MDLKTGNYQGTRSHLPENHIPDSSVFREPLNGWKTTPVGQKKAIKSILNEYSEGTTGKKDVIETLRIHNFHNAWFAAYGVGAINL